MNNCVCIYQNKTRAIVLDEIDELLSYPWLVGWLFETELQSISGRLPDRERQREREKIDERKVSKQPSFAPTASAIGPCPTIIQISRTPQH